ncbi:hypothetical protein [Fusibacter paucivorans]|nr:hypothetical protein [Fusibacter paucivorans]
MKRMKKNGGIKCAVTLMMPHLLKGDVLRTAHGTDHGALLPD